MKKFTTVTKGLLAVAFAAALITPQASFALSSDTMYGPARTPVAPVRATLPNTIGTAMKPDQQAKFCYDFKTNFDAKGVVNKDDVVALNKILSENGIASVTAEPVFSETAVKKFQEKFASEILKPAGLTTSTGIVGAATRAKLNALYGCGNTKPQVPPISIDPIGVGPKWDTATATPDKPTRAVNTTEVKVASPKGGETLIAGQTYTLKFDYDETKTETSVMLVYLTRDWQDGATHKFVNQSVSNLAMFYKDTKEMKWTVPGYMVGQQNAGKTYDGFRIMVMICSKHEPCTRRGSSAGTFSIKVPSSPVTMSSTTTTPATDSGATIKPDIFTTLPNTIAPRNGGIKTADVTGNGIVDATDLSKIKEVWGPCAAKSRMVGKNVCLGDLNGDKIVNEKDFAIATAATDSFK